MKNTTLSFFVILVLIFSRCNNSSQKNDLETILNDSALYKYNVIERFSISKADTTSIFFSYPELTEKTPLADSLSKLILLGITSGENSAPSIEAYADSFIYNYELFSKEMQATMPWYMNLEVKIEHNSPNVFSIAAYEDEYTGGAHPNGYVIYTNLNRKTGKTISLSDIFKSGTLKTLNTIAEKLFREQNEIASNSKLEDEGYFVFNEEKLGTFSINNNFLLTKDGIQFYYNTYEIAPYVVGPSSVFIKWEILNQILKKEFVL